MIHQHQQRNGIGGVGHVSSGRIDQRAVGFGFLYLPVLLSASCIATDAVIPMHTQPSIIGVSDENSVPISIAIMWGVLQHRRRAHSKGKTRDGV